MLDAISTKRFTKPGPVAAGFMASTARVVGIMGPQGGGKTTVIINQVLKKAARQPASPIDGIARYRLIVWMRTYRELWAKVIPDWLEWIPKENKAFKISWTGGVDNPAQHSFSFLAIENGKKKTVQVEVWFRAVGDQTPTEAAKGLHATDAWLPESTSATVEMRKALFGRLGRYPSQEHGGAPHRQLFCDWNAGDPYNWTSEYFITDRTLDVDVSGRLMVEFFRQPGGRDAAAENLHNLPAGYYDDQISANADDPDWIRRMVDNLIGFMRDGKPVYENFSDHEHVSDTELIPWRGVPLIVAADAGLTPAAVIMQRNHQGEWQCLEEIVTKRAGAEAFADLVVARLANPRYRDCPQVMEAFADPTSDNALESSSEGEDAQLQSWLKIMTKRTKFTWMPSRCENNLIMKMASVNLMLTRRIGTRLVFRICRKHNPTLIKGLARDYKFEKVASVSSHGSIVYKEKPSKNFASHVCNAFEYGAANGGEQDLVMGKASREDRLEKAAMMRRRQAKAKSYDPLGRYGAH